LKMKTFKKHVWILAACLMVTTMAMANRSGLKVTGLQIEYQQNPVGIDQQKPRFFWLLESNQRNTLQDAYHLQVSLDRDFRKSDMMVWDTDMIASDQSIQVVYKGAALESGTRYFWRVKVRDNHNNVSAWSETAFWEMGLLKPTDWKAKWIEVSWEENKNISQPVQMLRKEFALKGPVRSARLYATAMGLYEVEINGKKVGDQLFTPGWTSYSNRVQYQTYEISQMLQTGNNAMGVMLGDGWYRGFLGWGDQRNTYGEKLAFKGQIQIIYMDGSSEVIVSDESWKASAGPIVQSDIYNGEIYDARLEKEGWSRSGFEDTDWKPVKIITFDQVALISPQAPPVKKIQELKPVNIFTTPAGDTVLDFGQNMVGWIRLQVAGPSGARVVLRHAETLDKYGNFYTENLRSADQTNAYILKGTGIETWEPRFTFQGFRYVSVGGYPGDIHKPGAFKAMVIHSEMEPTGHFDCSHPLVNRLQHNIVWGQKGNFLDVPTDCPQRDERLGWTGDIQVFANTASINMNTAGFLTRWLGDLKADQRADGAVHHVIPNVLGDGAGAAGWADAATIVPTALYQAFADERILETQYESMKKWVKFIEERAATAGDPHVWDTNWHFGDWLSFATLSHPSYPGAHTHTDLIATAYFARSTSLTLKAAKLLGKDDDVRYYSALLEKIKIAFQKEFITPNGRLSSDTQTAYLLALQYDLIPQELRTKAADYLMKNVASRGHLTTGFLGTPHLNHVLSEFGYHEDAYKLLMREQYPSWLYPVTMGATTIWERWDGMKPDSTFQSESMNSFNHYAYGAIGEWLFKRVAGISPQMPGYKSIKIHPIPGGGLSHARAIQQTPYGEVASSWHFTGSDFVLKVRIPANTNAEIILPFAAAAQVKMPEETVSRKNPALSFTQQSENVFVAVGSGEYTFRYPAAGFPAFAKPSAHQEDTLAISYSKNSTLADLLANDGSRSILMQDMPKLMQSPWLSQVMGFSLETAMETLPQSLKMTAQELDAIDSKLMLIK
jgi:alpha-L-rhamnosidase